MIRKHGTHQPSERKTIEHEVRRWCRFCVRSNKRKDSRKIAGERNVSEFRVDHMCMHDENE